MADLPPPTHDVPERYRVEKIVSARWGKPQSWTLESYLRDGGYEGLKKALTQQPAALIDQVKESNLRGRGGAGFPTGMKWGFIPKDNPKPRYLAVNADGERAAGTFKDRYIMDLDPHLLIEGSAIAAYAIGAHQAYIYIRGMSSSAPMSGSKRLSRRPIPRDCSARSSAAATTRSTSTSIAEPAPTSAARRRPCSSRWRASAAGPA